MKKKFFAGMVLLLLVGCAGAMSLEKREEMYGKTVPEISHAFASREMKLGGRFGKFISMLSTRMQT